MVRETVAIETLARSATVRISMRTGVFCRPRADFVFVFLAAMGAGRECVYRIRRAQKKSRNKKMIS
jgi:hypothetical protein